MRCARVLLAFLLVFLAGCGSEQDRALAEIKRLDGNCTVDPSSPDKPVVVVDLGFRSADDTILEQVKKFPKLRELYLWNTGVTDAGLVHLQGLSELQKLDLSGTAVTDAGLKHLKGLTNLREVNLKGNRGVTAAGVRELQQALPRAKIIR